ncbi:galectin-3 isoform X2 [Salarias fasciatus]|uniref:galectin-3 isoform X2 n=1 Tax=Salarias fasciatus TaxID=181472 RepID=UPI0011770416|nr:galectin-3-like isoform X2 [Salarias fasciatus]
MDVSTSSNPHIATLHSDALCGPCPPSGSVAQPTGLWPSLPSPSGGFPAWPAQLTQPAQPAQPAPCWTGQPNTPCWPGTQPAVSVPAPMTISAPAQVMAPAAAPAPIATVVPAQAQALPPNSVQPCQPCWPGTQYQPQQTPAPIQAPVPAQTPLPTPVPAPAPAPSVHPGLPGWAAHPGWPYNPGQSGWPGQSPSLVPIHWLPPTSGPLSVPYNLNLARGVYDKMMMTILGHVKPNAKMFTVNFLRGNDIAFHINPRFNEGGKQVVVRNHKLGERWGPEERDLKGPFPFALGSPFEANVWKRWKRALDKGAAVLQGGSWR